MQVKGVTCMKLYSSHLHPVKRVFLTAGVHNPDQQRSPSCFGLGWALDTLISRVYPFTSNHVWGHSAHLPLASAH